MENLLKSNIESGSRDRKLFQDQCVRPLSLVISSCIISDDSLLTSCWIKFRVIAFTTGECINSAYQYHFDNKCFKPLSAESHRALQTDAREVSLPATELINVSPLWRFACLFFCVAETSFSCFFFFAKWDVEDADRAEPLTERREENEINKSLRHSKDTSWSFKHALKLKMVFLWLVEG